MGVADRLVIGYCDGGVVAVSLVAVGLLGVADRLVGTAPRVTVGS